MISFDFEYYRPKSIKEATDLYQNLASRGGKPIYYSGGTEIITLGRLNRVYTDAVIDIKSIPETQTWGFHNNELITGSALPLSIFNEKNYFPLLAETAREIADYTSRIKITIGGNICGQIFYREGILPFLLTDSDVLIAGSKGVKRKPLKEVFDQKLMLEREEFLVQLATKKIYMEMPFLSVKKRQQWKTGYPLLTVASLKKDGFLRFAFSGVCPFPFRSEQMETVLNSRTQPYEERALASFDYLPQPILNDIEGSNEYRLFVLKNTIVDFLKKFEGDENK
ncbi:FAD binding domain-containing protein [Domibacillus epiphyticus]|uniref:Xanthine dehydrogenase n=1 Tax=Domibacillus epiphyticus TaxID=1714355 RepID=A0A1V2A5U1_9BACI|nr:FAD binding domain-containing protein [Domibacillus epiphyticus]OMP66348.1 xanthine dehydrogenase [Domibacillus epiphyticus]